MQIMKCPNCSRTQSKGKFCLDCGSKLNMVINKQVQFKAINSGKSSDKIKSDIRKWLNRIGVQNPDIQIYTDRSMNVSEVDYMIDNNTYQFKSIMQKNVSSNLAAIEQFLHYRVLGIERGIETIEKAFSGYEALPDFTKATDPYLVLGFTKPVSIDEARVKFKQLVKKYHPDLNKNKDTQEEFNRIKMAMDQIEDMKNI